MGIAEGIENFFIACGFTAGIAASGGAGLAMANWIANGDPGMDLWPFDLRRFGQLHNGLAYLRDAAIESLCALLRDRLARGGARGLPSAAPLAAARDARRATARCMGRNSASSGRTIFCRTARRAVDRNLRARGVRAGGRARAQGDPRRRRADRHVVVLEIRDDRAGRLALSCNGSRPAISTRAPGAVVYTQLLNAKGGIEADLTIMQPTEGTFYVVTGSGFGVRDGGWIQQAHAARRLGRLQAT